MCRNVDARRTGIHSDSAGSQLAATASATPPRPASRQARYNGCEKARMADDTASIQAFGEEVITGMCEQLLQGGAPGLHFYTLNQAEASLALWNNLKLPR